MAKMNQNKQDKLTDLLGQLPGGLIERSTEEALRQTRTRKSHPALRWVAIAAAAVMIVGVMCTASIMGSIAWKRSHPAGISTVEPGTQISPEGTEGLAYTAVNHGTAWSVSVGEAGEESEIVIPATYEGLPVTEIGEYAFYEHIRLKKIVIPDSITKIGMDAFAGCPELTDVTLPESVTELGPLAFAGCEKLTQITVPDGVDRISGCLFAYCSALQTVILPDGVTQIEGKAFEYCKALQTITVPAGVKEIGMDAFAGAPQLTAIIYPGTMLQWKAISKGEAWDHDTGNYTVICSDGELKKTAGQTEPEVTTGKPASSCLHENTGTAEKIRAATCTESGSIYRVCLKCGEVLSKEETAPTGHHFEKEYEESSTCREEGYLKEKCRDCEETRYTDFDKVDHSYDADGICEWCFATSSGFMFRKNEDGESYTFMGAGASFTGSVLEIPAEYNGKPVTVVDLLIGSRSGDCFDSETILPACVTEIRYPATVKSIGLPDSDDMHPNYWFPDYSHITAVSLPEGLEYIGGLVLNHSAITELTIPSTVKHIGFFSFGCCNRLVNLELRCTGAEIDETAFLGVARYDAIMGWDGPIGLEWEAQDTEGGFGLCLTGPGTFHDGVLILPQTYHGKGITGISEEAFKDCTFLEEVYIPCLSGSAKGSPDGNRAFAGCTNLKKVEYGDFSGCMFWGFGDGYFAGCTSLERVTLPYCEMYYGLSENMFAGCTSLKEITWQRSTAEWNVMMEDEISRKAIPAGVVIHCTDGNLVREANAEQFSRLP